MRIFALSSSQFSLAFALALAAGCAPADAPVESQSFDVVYGTDDRVEVPDASADEQGAAEAVAAVLDYSEFAGCAGGECTIDLLSYESWFSPYGLCSDEPFRDQYTAGFCTAFLVDDDLVATAGHCVTNYSCGSTAFVFGFQAPDATTGVVPGPGDSATLDVPESDVYTCDSVVKRVYTATGADYAVVRLDRAVTGRTPLCFRRTGKVANGASVRVIGSPYGLPLKVADNAVVKSSGRTSFSTNADSYGGNSGSPVLDADMTVQGILVRGNTDYTYDYAGHCYRSNECTDGGGCGGSYEDATHSRFLNSWVPTGTCYTP